MSLPNKGEHVVQMQRALNGLGAAWRGDWSDFDGRTLRAQLGDAATILTADDPKAAADSWLIGNGVCPEHLCWFEHCESEHSDAKSEERNP